MKIYFASVETHALSLLHNLLFSFYDMINSIPFRKQSWKVITNENLYGDLVTRDKSKTIS